MDWKSLADACTDRCFYRVVLPGITGLPVAFDLDVMPRDFPSELSSYFPVLVAMQQKRFENRISALETVHEPWPRDLLLSYLKADGSGNWEETTACLQLHIQARVSAADLNLQLLLEWGRSDPTVLPTSSFRKKCDLALEALLMHQHRRYFELKAELHVLFNELKLAQASLAEGDSLSCLQLQLSLFDTFGLQAFDASVDEARALQVTLDDDRRKTSNMLQWWT
jgi:hypothetical protein